jgi:pimeloyl-ACP methyl ester carboxylesterase
VTVRTGRPGFTLLRSLKWLGAALLAVAVAGCGSPRRVSQARIAVTPAIGLLDQPRTIVVSDLAPGEVVEVHARSPRPDGIWAAAATFQANGEGIVNIARDGPMSGSYHGVSPMGLFWSQRQLGPGSAPPDRVVTTLTVTRGSRELASTQVTQLRASPGVREHIEQLSTAGFVGHYFAPPGHARHPALIWWGGSEGGMAGDAQAMLLASHGIATLAIAYFDEPGLPCRLQDIPLEYFVHAIDWLRSRPDVDPGRVWMLSGSRGSEAELLLAAHWPRLVHGLVAEAPSSFPHGSLPGACRTTGANGRAPAWTLGGKPISTSNPIPVQRITGPVLLVSGGQDQVWPSEQYADQIMRALPRNGQPHIHLNYPTAGHLVLGIPYTPILSSELADGGTVEGNSAARASDWPAMIAFIAEH